jgi:four helix bundle protein
MVGERNGSGLNSEHGQVTEEFFMTRDEMRARTKAYASRVVKLCKALPDEWVARTLGMQLLRSGTSVGANYRAVCRAKSTADFLNKLKIVEEECDESVFWMELLVDNNLVKPKLLNSLMQEGDEILSIVVASAKTTRAAQTS